MNSSILSSKILPNYWKSENEEVYYDTRAVSFLDATDIARLKSLADNNVRQRARICMHLSKDALTHEMFIVHKQGNYIRPHCHFSKSESLFVIEGTADLILWDEEGHRINTVVLSTETAQFYRINGSMYHTLSIKTPYFIYHETTSGPFNPAATGFPAWAPTEQDTVGVAKFLQGLSQH